MNMHELYRSQAHVDMVKEQLRVALMNKDSFSSDTASGGYLIPPHLAQEITKAVIQLVPELAIPQYIQHDRKLYTYDVLSKLPGVGSFAGEKSITKRKSPRLEQRSIEMKIAKRVSEITGFLEAMSRGFTNAEVLLIQATLEALGFDIRTAMMYGNKGADKYYFDGLDVMIASNRRNYATGGVIPTNYSDLDYLLNRAYRKGAKDMVKTFLMSPEMLTKYGDLAINVRDNRPAMATGENASDIRAGVNVVYYKDVPITVTTATRPTEDMGAIGYAASGGGSNLPAETRIFQVAPVTVEGEQIASPEVSGTTTVEDEITLSWAVHEGAHQYRIYAGTVTENLKLVKIVSAFIYDENGEQTGDTTSVTFTTEPLIFDGVSVKQHMKDDTPLVRTNDEPSEIVILWCVDPVQGIGNMIYGNIDGSEMNGLVTVEPLGKTDDSKATLFKTYLALEERFEATSGMVRGLRTK